MSTHLTDCAVKRGILLFVIITWISNSFSLTINRLEEHINTKAKIELSPLRIECSLNTIIQIALPMINDKSIYRLYKPNGDIIKLDIKTPKTLNSQSKHSLYNTKTIVVRYPNNSKPIVQQLNKYRLISLFMQDFNSEENMMDNNEVMIGPLQVGDGGNWILCVYTKDLDDNWIELFQVISVIITETVPLNLHSEATLHVGDTLNLTFAYPIKNIESCELHVPRSAFDRFFTRYDVIRNNCGFSVPNLTKKDKGAWAITGITKDRTSHRGTLMLNIRKRKAKKYLKSLLLFY